MRLIVVIAAVFCYVAGTAVVVVLPIPMALLLMVTRPFDRNRAVAGRFLRLCAALISRFFPFWRIEIQGRWPEGHDACVVVANHQSNLDILLLSNLPWEMKWLAKRSLFRIPCLGWCFRMAGDIPVDRGDAESALSAVARAQRYLAQGMSVMVFPEGTRSLDGRLLPFKTGAFKLAVDAGVSVLPIAVSGTGGAMPKGSFFFRPAKLTIRILDPVSTKGHEGGAVRKVRKEVRDRIAEALEGSSGSGPGRAAAM